MPTVTGLREDRRGRVAVELDGSPWRTFPADVVVRAGISHGRALDRPALRVLRRELRRAEALAVAGRALRARDLSARELAMRLEQRAVAPSAAEESLAALAAAGLLDDARLAENRAGSLAERGYGDAAIRHDLERRGVPADLVEAAVAGLEPERDRAGLILARRGTGAGTARYLAGKGFGEDVLEQAVGSDFGHHP
ncbi:MAG: RecX family transcriptional regulator [Actinobacteria bacterium]|nr:RecX family transcriptional regulator [Actinomycetota bacterium]